MEANKEMIIGSKKKLNFSILIVRNWAFKYWITVGNPHFLSAGNYTKVISICKISDLLPILIGGPQKPNPEETNA